MYILKEKTSVVQTPFVSNFNLFSQGAGPEICGEPRRRRLSAQAEKELEGGDHPGRVSQLLFGAPAEDFFHRQRYSFLI